MQEMMKKAQELMSQMSPAEIDELRKTFDSMSDDQKAELMKQAKSLYGN